MISMPDGWRLYLRATPGWWNYSEDGHRKWNPVSVHAEDDRGGTYLSTFGGSTRHRGHEELALRFLPRLDPAARALKLTCTGAGEEVIVDLDSSPPSPRQDNLVGTNRKGPEHPFAGSAGGRVDRPVLAPYRRIRHASLVAPGRVASCHGWLWFRQDLDERLEGCGPAFPVGAVGLSGDGRDELPSKWFSVATECVLDDRCGEPKTMLCQGASKTSSPFRRAGPAPTG